MKSRPLGWLLGCLLLTAAACGDSGTTEIPTAGAASTATGATISAPATTVVQPDSAGVAEDYDLQGHRGARGLRPENTLPSFEAALDVLVATLEADLHFTADGQVVVWHDPTVDPSKCGLPATPPPDLPDPDVAALRKLAVRALTADQLGAYRCDRNPDPDRFPRQLATAGAVAGDSFGIVTVAELFDFVAAYAEDPGKSETQRANAARIGFNLETKRVADDPGTIDDDFDGRAAGPFELALLKAIDAAGVASRTTVQSFDHRSLWAIAAIRSDLGLAALSSRSLPDFADLAARGATIWSPNAALVSPASLGKAHEAGLLVIPWTVNDPDDMQRLLDLGVDGIITDRPDLAPERP